MESTVPGRVALRVRFRLPEGVSTRPTATSSLPATDVVGQAKGIGQRGTGGLVADPARLAPCSQTVDAWASLGGLQTSCKRTGPHRTDSDLPDGTNQGGVTH